MVEKTLSEARKDLSRLVTDCAKNNVTVVMTVRGKPAAYLRSPAWYDSLKRVALEKEMEPIFNDFNSLFKASSAK